MTTTRSDDDLSLARTLGSLSHSAFAIGVGPLAPVTVTIEGATNDDLHRLANAIGAEWTVREGAFGSQWRASVTHGRHVVTLIGPTVTKEPP